MTTQIYYFSGTGNSLLVAKKLSKQLPDSELIPMVSTYKNGVKEIKAEKVGFIFPVHGFTLPKFVEEFIASLSFNPDTYVFAMATRGGSCCKAFEDTDKILSKQGVTLSSYSFVEMPNNYLTFFNIPTEEEATLKTTEAEEPIEKMATAIEGKEIYHPKDPHYSFVEKNILFPLLTQVHRKTKGGNYGNKMYADSKCTGCSTCSKVCLADRVTMNDGKPEWDKDTECMLCFACIHYCPRQAVQIKSTKTPKVGRYHHPEVSAADIMAEKH